MNIWLSLKAAAAKISVSVDTINRRALEWQDEPVPGRIRFKRLKLGEDQVSSSQSMACHGIFSPSPSRRPV